MILSYVCLFLLNMAENLLYFRMGSQSGANYPSFKYFAFILVVMAVFAGLQYLLFHGPVAPGRHASLSAWS